MSGCLSGGLPAQGPGVRLSGSIGGIPEGLHVEASQDVLVSENEHLVVLALGPREDQGVAVDILHTFTLGCHRLGCRDVGLSLLRRLALSLEAVEGKHAALMQVNAPMCGGW